MMRLLAFVLLTLVLAPAFVVGVLFYTVPVATWRGRVSGTAYEPFNARLIYHLLGTRPDPFALKLARGLPATGPVVMLCMVRPLAWALRVTGFTPSIFSYPPPRPTPAFALIGARCEFIDRSLAEFARDGGQIVILGAGWDTRVYEHRGRDDLACFEVDAPTTQAEKRAAIEKTGIDASHVTFVPCDFTEADFMERLDDAGFDRSRRTLFIWEGVMMYLRESEVLATFRAVASMPKGSRVVCDFLTHEWLMQTLLGKSASLALGLYYGERFYFGMPVNPEPEVRLRAFLREVGLTLVDHWMLGLSDPPIYGLIVAERS